jgi:hypothetical protein
MPCLDCYNIICKMGIRKLIFSIGYTGCGERLLCKLNVEDIYEYVKESLGRRYLNNK